MLSGTDYLHRAIKVLIFVFLVVLIQEAVGDTLLQYQPSQACSGRTPIISKQRFYIRGSINAVYLNVLSDASIRVFVSHILVIFGNFTSLTRYAFFSANESTLLLVQ